MEVDVSSSMSAGVVEGLKKEEAEDAPTPNGEQQQPEGEQPEGEQEAPPLGVDADEFDRAIGKLWIVGWGIAAKQLDSPELKEEKEMLGEAADALGPVARKHIPRQMQKFGPEAVAMSWIAGRIFSKMDHL